MFQSTPSGGKATNVRPVVNLQVSEFQSTPSGGKATQLITSITCNFSGFNPRLPGGRRRRAGTQQRAARCFNPRLPGGRRLIWAGLHRLMPCFNPRLPGGRRPHQAARTHWRANVSIHAFRGEGDQQFYCIFSISGLFQSTPSGGKATLPVEHHQELEYQFQSTPSGGKATRRPSELRDVSIVSIHAFRGEGDRASETLRVPGRMFQSTPSGGKATVNNL